MGVANLKTPSQLAVTNTSTHVKCRKKRWLHGGDFHPIRKSSPTHQFKLRTRYITVAFTDRVSSGSTPPVLQWIPDFHHLLALGDLQDLHQRFQQQTCRPVLFLASKHILGDTTWHLQKNCLVHHHIVEIGKNIKINGCFNQWFSMCLPDVKKKHQNKMVDFSNGFPCRLTG